MAELDPRQTQPMDASETAVVEETPVVVEETLVLPANRPRKVYGGMWGPVEIGVDALPFAIEQLEQDDGADRTERQRDNRRHVNPPYNP